MYVYVYYISVVPVIKHTIIFVRGIAENKKGGGENITQYDITTKPKTREKEKKWSDRERKGAYRFINIS